MHRWLYRSVCLLAREWCEFSLWHSRTVPLMTAAATSTMRAGATSRRLHVRLPNGNGPTPVGCSLSHHLGFHILDPQRNMSLPAIIDVLSGLNLVLFQIAALTLGKLRVLDEKSLFGMEIKAWLWFYRRARNVEHQVWELPAAPIAVMAYSYIIAVVLLVQNGQWCECLFNFFVFV